MYQLAFLTKIIFQKDVIFWTSYMTHVSEHESPLCGES